MADEHPPPVSAAAAAAAALRDIADVIGKESENATAVVPTEEGWSVEVEVVDDRHIPPSADMLALYEVVLDLDGELLSYRSRAGTGAAPPSRWQTKRFPSTKMTSPTVTEATVPGDRCRCECAPAHHRSSALTSVRVSTRNYQRASVVESMRTHHPDGRQVRRQPWSMLPTDE
ncbi:gas vesicle protein GvpO [Rhodococcus opacus]